MQKKKIIFLTTISSFISIPYAFADVVWPALYLETRILSWWVISLGLIVEYAFIRNFLKTPIKKSIIITATMNLASSLLGVALVPLAGIVWEFFPGIIIYRIFHIGTFNLGTWAATFLMATFINAAIEALVISKGFKIKIGKKGFWLLCGINALSIAIAFGSLFVYRAELQH